MRTVSCAHGAGMGFDDHLSLLLSGHFLFENVSQFADASDLYVVHEDHVVLVNLDDDREQGRVFLCAV